MSLINQMLRDLEQRNNTSSHSAALNIELAKTENTTTKPWVWLLITVVLVAVAYFGFLGRGPEQPPKMASNPVPIAPPPPISAPAIHVEPAIPVEVAPTLASPITTPATPPNAQTATTAPIPEPDRNPPEIKQNQLAVEVRPQAVTQAKAEKKARQAPLSPQQRLQALYREAETSASQLMRKETLKEALALEPGNLHTRDLLLETLLKTGPGNELEEFLHDSLMLFPNHLAFVTSQAQLQMQHKNYAAASATLERIDSSQTNEPVYLALLAASYQQQKRFQNAAPIYQRLTQLQPEKAENWLGLGICAENLQQRQTAIRAYQQALAKNTLNGEVVSYINQRLSALN